MSKESSPQVRWKDHGLGQLLGGVIAGLRLSRGLERSDLAERASMSYAHLSGLEVGNRWPTDASLRDLSVVLGYNPRLLADARDALLDEEPDSQRAVYKWLGDLGHRCRFDSLIGHKSKIGGRVPDLSWCTADEIVVVEFELKAPKAGSKRTYALTAFAGPGAVGQPLAVVEPLPPRQAAIVDVASATEWSSLEEGIGSLSPTDRALVTELVKRLSS